jgi:hypothetical protein
VVEFTADQVATWLEEANAFRRARWVHWPDAHQLAADLSEINFTDRFVAHHQVTRKVRQFTAMLRRMAAAWDDPAMSREVRRVLVVGIGPALSNEVADLADDDVSAFGIEQLVDHQVATMLADARAIGKLGEAPERFSGLLLQAADETEWQLSQDPGGDTHADHVSVAYGLTAHTLSHHTGSPPTIRAVSPDARFCRDVLEHAEVPWRARLWRRCAEEWAAVRRGEGDGVRFVSRLRPANRAGSLQEK